MPAMVKLFGPDGKDVVVGKSTGYWLNESDFVSTADLTANKLGNIGFPRDWPNVYTSSKALKSLIGKKGRCAGKKVGVVAFPLPEELDQVKGLRFYHLQSFSNAERVEKAAGFPVVYGYAIFEHMDMALSEAFVAERYWWNAMPDGKWVDFTPRPEEWQELLLAEAANGAPKTAAKITQDECAIATTLLKYRFGAVTAAPPAPMPADARAPPPAPKPREAEKKPSAPGPAAVAKSSSAGGDKQAMADMVRKVIAGDVKAVLRLEEQVQGNEELAAEVAGQGVTPPLVKMLGNSEKQEAALKLLLLLSDAGVGRGIAEISAKMITEGIVRPLVKIMAGTNTTHIMNELAAAVIGNLCHESRENQDKVAKCGVFKPLVDLLGSPEVGPAQEAAYAIWNLTVGHEENSARVVGCGAVPKLVALLSSSSDIAQENGAGALMHVTMSEEARTAIVQADAIPRLAELLGPSFEPEVNSQAAGALLNLASDSPTYAKLIVRANAVGPLINLVKDGADLAREYAAGALMNIIRGDLEVADKAAKEGAIPALASLLQRPCGHSEALGALANLASGSAERQIAIYKAQVTRKSVSLLSDPDVDVRRSAAALIMNLAPHNKIKERVVEAGALKPLCAILADEDVAVRERAAGALANLFNDHSANVHAGFNEAPSVVDSLVNILNSPQLSEDAKRQSAHALAMLAAEDGPCDAVWAAGAGPPLLELLRDMVAEAALGIMNLSWRWPEVKEELARGGAIEYLLEMIKISEPMAKEYAAGALMNMTAGSTANAEKALSAVPTLVDLLRADGVQCTEWASGALANVIRVGGEPQATAADAGAATALAALLPKVTANGKTLVILALTALAEEQSHKVMKALSGPKEKSKLREYRDGSNEELSEYTNTLVDKIGNGFTL